MSASFSLALASLAMRRIHFGLEPNERRIEQRRQILNAAQGTSVDMEMLRQMAAFQADQLEKAAKIERPYIEAAEQKRLRKQAKRLRRRYDNEPDSRNSWGTP